MRTQRPTSIVRTSVTTAGVAAVVTFVFLLQPWRTCPDDDAPAGCPALPQDAAVVMVAGTVVMVALVVAVVAAVRSGTTPSPPASTAPEPTAPRPRRRLVILVALVGLCAAVYGWGFLGGYWPP